MPQVTVDDQKPQDAPKNEEQKYVSLDDLEKIRQENEGLKRQLNGISYSLRKVDELAKRFETIQQPQPQQKIELPKDEWEVKLEKDWKGTVEELAERRFQELRKREREEDQRRQEEQRTMSTLQKSQQEVLSKYAELNDPSSELSQRFLRVLDRHPEYKTNEYGPILTMREMEEELRSEGRMDDTTKKVVDKEIIRQARAGVTSIPKGSAASPQSNTLTAAEKEFCDLQGIKYDSYLQSKKMMQRREAE